MQLLKGEIKQSSVDSTSIEEKLKESREEFQCLFNLMPDPVVIVDGKGSFLAVNDRVEEVTGFKREELLRKNFIRTKTVTAKSKAILIKNLAKRMMGFHIEPYEVEVLTKEGKKLPFEINAARIRYGGNPADLVVLRSVTERKRAGEALKKSEEKFRNIFESANDALIFLDKSGRILDVNTKAAEVFGGSKEELLGKHFTRLNVFSPKEIPRLMSTLAKILAGGKAYPSITIRNKKGQEIYLECSGSLMKMDNKLAGVMVVARDITERRKIEDKLKEYAEHLGEKVEERTKDLRKSEEKLRSIFTASPYAITVTDLDGNIIDCNQATLNIHGFTSKKDLIGKSTFEFIAEKDRRRAEEDLKKTLEQGSGKNISYTCLTRDGREFPVELSASVLRDASGNPTSFVGITIDITERKRMEEALLRSERLAAIGELATMVGHDLRNPLQSIENAVYYLNNELSRLSLSTPIPEKAIEMLQVIDSAVTYADKIIRDLQDFSATKKPTLKKTDINALIEHILLEVEIPENVELITQLESVPKIEVDEDMMKRVFLNLAMNGLQAMENEGILAVSTRKTKRFVEISFKDTGVGISKGNMDKVFTPFFTTKPKGMGMGLAICKRLVDAHGGSIRVKSEEGRGSTFTVKLHIQ